MNGRQSSQALRANPVSFPHSSVQVFWWHVVYPSCLSPIGVAKVVFDGNFTKPVLMFLCFLIDKFSSSQWAIIMKPEIINELRVLFCIYVIFWFFFFFPLNFAFFFFPFPRYSLPLTYSNLHTLTILKKCILTRECERREQLFN